MYSLKFMDTDLNISKERKLYNDIRLQFANLAYELENQFKEVYKKNNRSLSDVSQYAYSQGSDCIAVAISKAVKILLDNEIYHIDEKSFIENYYLNYHTWDEDFNKINDLYMEIVLDQNQLNEYRKVRRQNRGRLVGGGFGLSGAAKGIATAGTVNLVSGALHGVFNGIGKMISAGIAASKKDRIFRAPSTLKTLADGVNIAVFNVHYALVDAINSNSRVMKIGSISQEDEQKANAIFNNLKRMQLDKAKSIGLIKEILTMNPYRNEFYEYIIDEYGDRNSNLQDIAEYFGIGLKAYKHSIISDYFDESYKETEEKALKMKKDIVEIYRRLGLKDDNEYLAEINSKLVEFDEIARTFFDILFDTREEAKLAKEERDIIEGLFEEIVEKNTTNMIEEELLRNFRKHIVKHNLKTRIADKYINEVDRKLQEIDIEARTLDDIIFDTREEAKIAKEEKEIIVSIIKEYETEFNDEVVIKKMMNKIKSHNYTTKIIDKYISLLDHCLEVLDQDKRTIDGILYETLEEVSLAKQKMRDDININIKDLLDNLDNKNVKSICMVYDSVNNPVRFKNAIKKYAKKSGLTEDEKLIILVDDTAFGSGKKGMLITDRKIYTPYWWMYLDYMERIEESDGLLGKKYRINGEKDYEIQIDNLSNYNLTGFISLFEEVVDFLNHINEVTAEKHKGFPNILCIEEGHKLLSKKK